MLWRSLILLALAWVAVPSAFAAQEVPAALLESAGKLLPGLSPKDVRPSPVAGLFEVSYGPRVFYLSADGKYLLRGDVVDIARRVNLTERTRRAARLRAVEALGEDTMIVFSPAQPKHTITVFTDVDCPYCARLHREVPRLNELGVRVRYAAFPRGGIPSRIYDKMVSVWCAADSRQAMTDAKAGKPVPPATCPNSIAEHFALARSLGINGTPSILLDSGELIPGYVPYKRLLSKLEGG